MASHDSSVPARSVQNPNRAPRPRARDDDARGRDDDDVAR